MNSIRRQPTDYISPAPYRLVDFWLWAGVRLTAGGFMAGCPAI